MNSNGVKVIPLTSDPKKMFGTPIHAVPTVALIMIAKTAFTAMRISTTMDWLVAQTWPSSWPTGAKRLPGTSMAMASPMAQIWRTFLPTGDHAGGDARSE